MCVECVLALSIITQADPGQRTPPYGGSVTLGWSLHEPVLRFGYDDDDMLLESTGKSPELS
jgi:hypothetical protein